MIRYVVQVAGIVLSLVVGASLANWLVARSDSRPVSLSFPAHVDGWTSSLAESPSVKNFVSESAREVDSRVYRNGHDSIQIDVVADTLGFGGTDRLIREDRTIDILSLGARILSNPALKHIELVDGLHWHVEEMSPQRYAVQAYWYELANGIVKNRIELKAKSVSAIFSADSNYGIVTVTMICDLKKCADAIAEVNAFSATLIGQNTTFIEATPGNDD